VGESNTHPQKNWGDVWPLQQPRNIWHYMINIVLIEKLGGAMAPGGLQRDPPLCAMQLVPGGSPDPEWTMLLRYLYD